MSVNGSIFCKVLFKVLLWIGAILLVVISIIDGIILISGNFIAHGILTLTIGILKGLSILIISLLMQISWIFPTIILILAVIIILEAVWHLILDNNITKLLKKFKKLYPDLGVWDKDIIKGYYLPENLKLDEG